MMNEKSRLSPFILEGEDVLCFLEPFQQEIAVTSRRLLFTRNERSEYGVVIVPLGGIQSIEATDSKITASKSFVRVMFGNQWHTFSFTQRDSPAQMHHALIKALGW